MTENINIDSASQEALDKLSRGTPIPGLDSVSVVDQYTEVEFKDSLDECKTPEERDARKKEFKEYYTEGNGKAFIDKCIGNIEDMYGQVSENVRSLNTSIINVTASNTIPAVITTGSAASVSNPAYVVIENKQKKNSLVAILNLITNTLAELIGYAMLIHFVLPEYILMSVVTLGVLREAINMIP